MEQIRVREATADDLVGVLAVQHEAFGRVAAELRIPCEHLPPLRETLDDLRSLDRGRTRFFVAESGGEIVGAVRGTPDGDSVEVGRLVVARGVVRRGVATALMHLLERSFPNARRFVLFTGADAAAPLALYEKLGYVRTRVESVESVRLVWLQKDRT